MRWILRLFGALIVLGLAAVLGVYLAVRRDTPGVPLDATVETEDVLVLRAIVKRAGDPRALAVGDTRSLTVSAEELAILSKIATSRVEGTGLRAEPVDGAVRVHVSRVSPRPDVSPYVDVQADLSGTPKAPRIAGVQLGSLPVPGAVAQPVFDEVYARLKDRFQRAAPLLDAIEGVESKGGQVTVRYRWTQALADTVDSRGRGLVAMQLGEARLRDYQAALVEGLKGTRRRAVSLSTVMRPLFAKMRERGARDRVEWQAAFFVATAFVLERALHDVTGLEVEEAPRRTVRLWRRTDLPKHFLVSALVAAVGDRAFADALGLSKEITDSEAGGSGFSFVDLAADRAGTQLVERALARPEVISAVLEQLSSPKLTDPGLLPDPRDLPEGLTEAELESSGRAPGTPKYQALVDEMDGRLAKTDLHRTLLTK